jgi:YD repeat-containing protein
LFCYRIKVSWNNLYWDYARPIVRFFGLTDRPGGVTTYGYTPGGQVSALTDAENQVTLYDYNARGEKTRETYPDHVSGAAVGTAGYGIVQFSYDPAGSSRPAANRLQGAHFA